MPRAVDRDARRKEIADAAQRLLSERGPGALTLRGLAEEMGGSITLITHFYPTRAALLVGITDQWLQWLDEDLARIEFGRTPEQRLRLLLEWMLPLSLEDKRRETGRVMMASERSSDLKVQTFYAAMDSRMRGLLREHLTPFVPLAELEDAVESLRVFANGIVLSAVERPTKWPRRRQLRALDFAMRALDLPSS